MPAGKPKCPVCHGSGLVTENAQEYEFVTRDPISSKCLVCNGTGVLNPSTKLPNGKRAYEVWRKGQPVEALRRLNVSKKAAVESELPDTGVGYGDETEQLQVESFPRTYRLNKVIKSGKHFLLVTETEPYYMEVYMKIRATERKQGTWSADDEERYVTALEKQYLALRRAPVQCMAIKEANNG